MFQTLRIIFALLSALCVAIVIPIGALAGLTYAIVCVALALVFFLAMLYFKGKQEQSDAKTQPSPPDFMNATNEKTDDLTKFDE